MSEKKFVEAITARDVDFTELNLTAFAAFPTVIEQVAFFPITEAVILALPALIALITPYELTVATLVSEELHATFVYVASFGVIVA